MIILRSRFVVTMHGPPIEDGAVVIGNGQIRETGRFHDIQRHSTAPVEDLGDSILLPGLINAHCHLDYTMLRRGILAQKTFAGWIRRINALKSSLDDADYLASVKAGFAGLVASGTTSVINIESLPEIMPFLDPPPLRTWWCLELMDIRRRHYGEAAFLGALQFFDGRPGWLGGFGLSPHAPYTASVDLYRSAAACTAHQRMLFTTHVAESTEELRMFAAAEGPLHELMRTIGRPTDDLGAGTPLAHLVRAGALPPDAILVHLNALAGSDFDLLAAAAGGRPFHVVHCPQSHAYFRHPPFSYEKLRDIGMNICLGTDSLASSPSLSLFDEMRQFADSHPAIPPVEVLAMATTNGAAALGQPGRLGVIAPGACADLIAIPAARAFPDPIDAIIHHHGPVLLSMIDGKLPARPDLGDGKRRFPCRRR